MKLMTYERQEWATVLSGEKNYKNDTSKNIILGWIRKGQPDWRKWQQSCISLV